MVVEAEELEEVDVEEGEAVEAVEDAAEIMPQNKIKNNRRNSWAKHQR